MAIFAFVMYTCGNYSHPSITSYSLDVRTLASRTADGQVVIQVLMGKVRGIVGQQFTGPGSKYVIRPPDRIIGVKCTRFIVDATLNDETTLVCVE